jgi:UDP-N-acetyl-D-glucosamine dehydrogenase
METREARIGIIGMGYVGLAAGSALQRRTLPGDRLRYRADKVKTLNAGGSYIVRILPSEIQQAQKAGFRATADYSQIARMDAVIICVPTPLNEHHEPDLSYVTGTVESIAPTFIREGQLIVLESTTYPGTTEEIVAPLLEAGNPQA